MYEVLFGSASEAADMVGRKEVSARELTEMLLARIDAVNPRLNAVVEFRREAALAEAAAADEVIARGGGTGPLHGVPITIKDCFNVAGMHTTWGNPAFRDFVAGSDATVPARLRRAGAVIAGKTNVPFMLDDWQTANELHGVTSNPWDTARTPGGSSGGSASAVSAGMTFLEYGTDLDGSIRIPASFCGVYGLKPSAGIVPLTGCQPPGPSAAGLTETPYMPVAGPLGRSAHDLRVALGVTAGHEDPAAKACSWRLPPPRHTRLGDFRVGVVLDDDQAPVSADVGSCMSGAVDAIARAGAPIVEGWPDGVDPAQSAESLEFHVGLFLAFQQAGEGFAPLSQVIEQAKRRMAARAAWNRYFSEVDVFLCPANFTTAFRHDARPFDERTITTPAGDRPYTDLVFWMTHASVPGLPAVAAPVGRTSGGLPVGTQILGPFYEDDTAITFAELLAEIVGGFQAPPI
jgi:amidase